MTNQVINATKCQEDIREKETSDNTRTGFQGEDDYYIAFKF